MKINFKEYFKLSAIYTIVGAVPPLLQVLVQPIIEGENRLNAIDFSHLAIVELVASFAFVFTLFSMGVAISRFYYDYTDSKGYKSLVASVFNSILFRGIILLIIAFIFRNHIGNLFSQDELKNFTSYGFAAIIIGINRSIIATAGALYRNEKKVKLFVQVNLLLTILRTGLQVAGIFLYDMSFLGYIYGTVIGTSCTSLTVLFLVYWRVGIRHNRKIMKEVNSYAWPLFQYGIIIWGLTFADRYFMEKNPGQLGIYNSALTFAIGIQLILQGVQNAVLPELFRFMKEGIAQQIDEIKKLSNLFIFQSQAIVVFSIIPTILFILFFYETDLRLASGFISIIFIRQIMLAQYNTISAPLYYIKKTKVFLYLNSIVLIVNLVLNFLLIPLLNIYGAIIAAIFANFIQVVGIYFLQKKIIFIKWNTLKVIWFPLATCCLACIMQLVQELFQLNPIIGAVIINAFFIFGVYILYKKELSRLWLKFKPIKYENK